MGNLAFASSTRGVIGGGRALNTLEFFTIMTTGNAFDFGDLSIPTHVPAGCSNATRGICNLRPSTSPSYSNVVDFITIATTGNSIDFGDSTNNAGGTGPMSSSTRALFAGGYGSPAFLSEIASFEIATLGNAVDFGDMSYAGDNICGLSNGHGGL